MKRIELASVGVNKAADQFVKAEDVRVPATHASLYSSVEEDEPDAGEVAVKSTASPQPSEEGTGEWAGPAPSSRGAP